MKLDAKGPIAPPPALTGALLLVHGAVTSWPAVTAHAHWDLYDPDRIDGVDYYVGQEELGHVHLNGEAHVATTPDSRAALLASDTAQPFRYGALAGYAGWCQVAINDSADAERATTAFRVNYQRLRAAAQGAPR